MYTSLFLISLATAYVTAVLTFDESSKSGPFWTQRLRVAGEEGIDYGPVNLFDRVRRLFGAYRIDGSIWTVYEPRMAVWRCPRCLSFWMSLLPSISYVGMVTYYSGDLRTILCWPVYHFVISYLSTFFAFQID